MALLASIAFWPHWQIFVNLNLKLNGSRSALKIGDISSQTEVKSIDHTDCYFLGNLCVFDLKGDYPLRQARAWVPLVSTDSSRQRCASI